MGKPYSLDLRKRVVAAIEGGMSRNQAAKRFGGKTVCPLLRWGGSSYAVRARVTRNRADPQRRRTSHGPV